MDAPLPSWPDDDSAPDRQAARARDHALPHFYGPPDLDEKLWSVACHLSLFVLPVLGPLACLYGPARHSSFIRTHALEATNGQFTLLTLAGIAFTLLIWAPPLYWLLLVVLGCAALFAVFGALAAASGQTFRYPAAVRLIRERETG